MERKAHPRFRKIFSLLVDPVADTCDFSTPRAVKPQRNVTRFVTSISDVGALGIRNVSTASNSIDDRGRDTE
jgi:hypothetical protein